MTPPIVARLISWCAATVRWRPLAPEDEQVFHDLDGPLEEARRGEEFGAEGKPAPSPRFLISGWACRLRVLGDGRRKIIAFILPGEGIGICRRPNPLAMCATMAITDCRTLPASPAFGAGRNLSRRLEDALHIAQSLDEAALLDHVVRLGRQTALERMGHLLLELHWRLSLVGAADEWRFSAPLTQDVLADATGLSVVHVNRTIQQLRRERLIEWRSQVVTILEPQMLSEIAEFKPPRPSDWLSMGGTDA
jgi:CRP-like cAMP-binding protein